MAKEFSPMKGQVPDATQIVCKNCVHRDRTVIHVDNETFNVGVTKGNCDMFIYPDSKPSTVLFNNADCEFYEEE